MDIKQTTAQRITQSRKALGITIKELSARIGNLSAARISNWEQGTRSPGPAEAKLLAEQLHVSASYLLGLTDNEQGELSEFSGNKTRFIPVLKGHEAAQAKELLTSGKNIEQLIVVDVLNKSQNSEFLFAIILEDNSMQPECNTGDLVVVDPALQPRPGDYVLGYLPAKNQTILRKYREAEGCLFQLIPNNTLWTTVQVNNPTDAVLVGVVVEVRKYSI